MSVDCSRFTFHPWKDYFGVVMQQGRVQLDADWNEWVAELARRLQAGAMDTLGPAEAGRAVVPSTTPTGFQITAQAGGFTIGVGRVYVDGLLVENHGGPANVWDPRLAEVTGTTELSFFEQPYLPFNATNQPAPADVFNRPVLAGGPHLVYLDVWQREVTHLQDPDLVEKAVGVDTTARTQTVWQVRVLQNPGNIVCATDDDDIPNWSNITRPSGARLTTSTGDLPDDPNPCLVAPSAGYKGLENQLYRVEIHRGGPQGTATFKWSRDNATVATRVAEIHGGTRLVVDSLGRDDVLGFHPGEWIEILDDWHELHGLPGLLRRIRPGDGVVAATRSILFDDALPAGLFPVDAQGRTDAARNTRIRRWDQSNQVRRANGSVFHDLNLSASSNGIPVPPAGTVLALENGILIELGLPDGGEYRVGDYWVFTARASDGTIDILDQAPPRGIHHHYARLAVVTLPNVQEDCRIHWPPAGGGESCDCTVCVHPEAHNAGTATIQQAIDMVRTRGGTVCLDAGTYQLAAPLNLDGARSVRIRGQGWRTLLLATQPGPLVNVTLGIGVAIENLAMIGAAPTGATTPVINATHCVDLNVSHLAILAFGAGDAIGAAVGLSGIMLACTVHDCTLVAERAVVSAANADVPYLVSANLRVTDSLLFCSEQGVRFAGTSLHYGETRIAGNLFLICAQAGVVATGATYPGSNVSIAGNVMQLLGPGIQAGVDGLRIEGNELLGGVTREPADAIALVAGLDKGAVDGAIITGNRIRGFSGNGIAIRHTLGNTMIKSNMIDSVGLAAIAMEDNASASYLCIENNHFTALGAGFNQANQNYHALLLLGVARGDVTGNVFAHVAREATQSPLRVALAAQMSAELRIAANRFFGIGPERFIGRTVAIGVGPTFNHLAVDDNACTRVADASENASPAAWQAIVVGTPSTDVASPTTGIAPPAGVIIVPMADTAVYLSAFRVGLVQLRRGTASVRGNRLRNQATTAPTVDIDDVVGCLLSQNDAEATAGVAGAAPAPIARIACRHVSANGNRLIGTGDSVTMAITTRQFAVVANITTGPIQVNGGALPVPWNTLNVPA